VETAWLKTLYILFFIVFIELGRLTVHLAGVTALCRKPFSGTLTR